MNVEKYEINRTFLLVQPLGRLPCVCFELSPENYHSRKYFITLYFYELCWGQFFSKCEINAALSLSFSPSRTFLSHSVASSSRYTCPPTPLDSLSEVELVCSPPRRPPSLSLSLLLHDSRRSCSDSDKLPVSTVSQAPKPFCHTLSRREFSRVAFPLASGSHAFGRHENPVSVIAETFPLT